MPQAPTPRQEKNPDPLEGLLCCPLCPERPPLRALPEGEGFVCACEKHLFPILDGFPALRPGDERPYVKK